MKGFFTKRAPPFAPVTRPSRSGFAPSNRVGSSGLVPQRIHACRKAPSVRIAMKRFMARPGCWTGGSLGGSRQAARKRVLDPRFGGARRPPPQQHEPAPVGVVVPELPVAPPPPQGRGQRLRGGGREKDCQ